MRSLQVRPRTEQRIIEQAAGAVGLAFQIQDDILDVTSTMEVLGKPIGSDEKNHKVTYVTFEGLEQSREDVARISGDALSYMDALPVKNEFLIRTDPLSDRQGEIKKQRYSVWYWKRYKKKMISRN